MLGHLFILTFGLAMPLFSWLGLRNEKPKERTPQLEYSYEYVCGKWVEVIEMPADDFLRLQDML